MFDGRNFVVKTNQGVVVSTKGNGEKNPTFKTMSLFVDSNLDSLISKSSQSNRQLNRKDRQVKKYVDSLIKKHQFDV
jgi:hypothetical protein